jgi:hypothetical protein
LPESTEPPAEPARDAASVDRAIRALRLIAVAQILGVVLLVGGMALLVVDLVRNHTLDCSGFGFAGTGVVSCTKHSYAWPVGLMIGGFGLTVLGVFVSTQLAVKHVGAPIMRAALARRRVLEGRAGDDPS